jgi:PncC family amidohydrolase
MRPLKISSYLLYIRKYTGGVMKDNINSKLAGDIVKSLNNKHLSIAAAESCTGGLLSKYITDVSGSSQSFLGSTVTYSNQAKTDFLKVGEKTLERCGAVSPECASEMAHGCQEAFHSDISVSVTGIAGPSGGTPEKPVGTVYMHICYKNKELALKKVYKGDREHVREDAITTIFSTLIDLIKH